MPKNWKELHLNLSGEIKTALEANQGIALGEDDPIKAIIALDNLFGVLDLVPKWTQSYIDKNRSEGIYNQLIESMSK